MARVTGIVLASLLFASTAHAVPGPDSVAVLANASVPGSVALAMRYAAMRDVPDAQVCALPMPATDTITLDEYRTMILEPLRACLGASEARIEAVVVMRGVPLRVTIPVDGGHNVSITAALGAWRSTLTDGTLPLLGTACGRMVDCGGTPCYAARVPAPYAAAFDGAFRAGFTLDSAGIHHAPILATMLHGRSDADAGLLLDAAMEAEASATPAGEFVLMMGADSARGALDPTYPSVATDLMARGVTVSTVPFDGTAFTGHMIAGFAVGTASMGASIEGNTYVRGALVDNLTSFGAVPQNFEASGESQVSIARWVAAGAAGAHGTVDEPLNNCFPSRTFLVSYVDGATLAESFLGAMPFAYWLNLVLGDPMLAPYAQRPTVAITGAREGASLSAAPMLSITASAPVGRAIAHLSLLVDGEEVASADGPTLDHCLAITAGTHAQILAVATTAPGAAGTTSPWPAKGWLAIHVDETAADATCDPAPVDGGPIDAGAIADASRADTGASGPPSAGCACRVRAGPRGAPALALALALALTLALASRSRSRSALPLTPPASPRARGSRTPR